LVEFLVEVIMNGFGVGLAARGWDATTRLAPLQALSVRALAEEVEEGDNDQVSHIVRSCRD
jgi:hypothetical protein